MLDNVELMFVISDNACFPMALVKTVQLIKGHKVQEAEAAGQNHAELTSSSYLMAHAGNVQVTRESKSMAEHAAQTSASQVRD